MSKQAVGETKAGAMFSPGVIAVGRFIWVSGQSPKRNGVVVGETIAEQTTVALENLAAILAEAGAGWQTSCGAVFSSMT